MSCPNGCNAKMQEIKVERLFHKDGERIIIKDLPIKVCAECGQEAIPLSSMRIIDDVLKGKVQSLETVKTPLYHAG